MVRRVLHVVVEDVVVLNVYDVVGLVAGAQNIELVLVFLFGEIVITATGIFLRLSRIVVHEIEFKFLGLHFLIGLTLFYEIHSQKVFQRTPFINVAFCFVRLRLILRVSQEVQFHQIVFLLVFLTGFASVNEIKIFGTVTFRLFRFFGLLLVLIRGVHVLETLLSDIVMFADNIVHWTDDVVFGIELQIVLVHNVPFFVIFQVNFFLLVKHDFVLPVHVGCFVAHQLHYLRISFGPRVQFGASHSGNVHSK